jgi:hypothetical protein
MSTVLAAALLLPVGLRAESVTVTIENLQPEGGAAFTPVWHAVHDGTFNAFDAGSSASAGIELVAELGDPSELGAEFTASGAAGVTGVLASPSGPPPFSPGQSNSTTIEVDDPTITRFFSFASMVVPSNDLFLGNDGAMMIEVFDGDGNVIPQTITIMSDMIWDAGTEVNDITDGPAFVIGQDATAGTPEDGVVTALFDVPGAEDYLASIVGVDTPIGTITDGLTPGEAIARISIVPEPTAGSVFALAGLALAALRRR